MKVSFWCTLQQKKSFIALSIHQIFFGNNSTTIIPAQYQSFLCKVTMLYH